MNNRTVNEKTVKNKMDVYVSVASLSEEDAKGKVVVVIDVLRACSTMIAALQNGAKSIIPVKDMDAASRISQNMDAGQFLLCGEKEGSKIDSYQLGNSPLEYAREVVEGKIIILNTTNGTKAVKKASSSKELIIGSFTNLNQVVEKLRTAEKEIALFCAGWQGRLALEDMLFAGNIIHELYGGQLPDPSTDSVKAAFELYQKYSDDIDSAIRQSDHARRLKDLVASDDLDYCCRRDVTDVLPMLSDGIITNYNGKEI
jgi:2-phosphosulfolactate phosphatase